MKKEQSSKIRPRQTRKTSGFQSFIRPHHSQMKTAKTQRFRVFSCSHRSQVKMFETIAILVVFFILIMFGFIFYTRVQKSTFQSELEESTVLRSIEIAEKVSFFPEIQCSRDNIQEDGCIDILKLESAGSVISTNNLIYFNILGYSNIYVEQIYPGQDGWDLYDFPKRDDSGKISTQFPTSIYDPRTDTYSFGVLYVDLYR